MNMNMDDPDGQPIVAYRKHFMNVNVVKKTEEQLLRSLNKMCSGNDFKIDYNIGKNGIKYAVRVIAIP